MVKPYLQAKGWMGKNLLPAGLFCMSLSFMVGHFLGSYLNIGNFLDGFLKGLGITLILGAFLITKRNKNN
jgi:hypothetical protein